MGANIVAGDDVQCVLECDAIVGESPLWHFKQRRLYWVDILGKKIHRFNPASCRNETFPLPDLVTSLAFCKNGGLLLTLRKDFAFFDPDTGKLEYLAAVESDLPDNRFNDGRCDRQGRFWAGTMGEKDWKAPVGSLYRLDPDSTVTRMRPNVVCSNGADWSPDNRKMYHTESFRYAIFAYDFDAENGAITNRRIFAEVDPESGAFPDGLTVDTDGFVWSNHVGVGRVVRYDPDGKIERVVQLPVPRATGCTFGGENLDTLYITTARETMTPAQLRDAPLSGSLFATRPGVGGLQAASFDSLPKTPE
jgi:sugar lactone lactonase YvrE